MERKQALITGVNGQDGSFLAELLLDRDYDVVGVIRRSSTDTSGRIAHLLDNPRLKVVEGDVSDPWSVTDLIRQLRDNAEVYNLAAQSHVATSFDQPQLTWAVTAGGCLNILEAVRKFNKTLRVYQASSSEMFGTNVTATPDGKGSQDEKTEFCPQSPYAIAKLAAHHAVGVYRKAYGIFGSCGILFNHESSRRTDTFVTQKICRYIGQLYHASAFELGSDLPIFPANFPKLKLGNLDASRDWGHARDYVRAMWLMLQQKKPDDYVICTGETHTVREFLDLAFGEIGIEKWTDFVEVDPTLFRPAEVPYLRGCHVKATNAFGWSPTTSFSSLVKEMVNYACQEAASEDC